MLIRCKFVCNSVTKRLYSNNQLIHEAEFSPVYTGSDENNRFFRSTPTGKLVIGAMSADNFTPGNEYYIDITKAS